MIIAPTATDVLLEHNTKFMLADCQRSGITPDEVEAMGWRATPTGYVIPYNNPAPVKAMTALSGEPFTRTRLRHPHGGCKYLSPKNGGIRCFIHPNAHEALTQTPDLPLYLTEGEKKAVCATLCGLPTIGLGGIWMWKSGKDDDSLNSDLVPYVTGGRDVVLIYDSDATETPKKTRDFADCARRLAVALEPYGCKLYRFDIPSNNGQKFGLDDWLIANGADTAFLQNLINGGAVE
jgi:hypothetical protein